LEVLVTTIIDTDTHITEPPDLWTSRLPEKWGDQRMHVQWNEQMAAEVWMIGDTFVSKAWAGCMWGWGTPFPSAPPRLADAHPSTYDVKERMVAMDASGIQVAVLYPNIAGLAFDPFCTLPDQEIAAAHVSAYNDFQLDWISPAPERFVPMAAVPYWDVDRAVREIERVAALGFNGIVTTGAPHKHGQPYLGDHHWDPMWSACRDAGMSVSFHAANGDLSEHLTLERFAVDGPAVTFARTSTSAFLDNAQQVTDLLCCGVLARFPEVKFVSVESGLGWIGFVLESCDYHFKKARVDKEKPEFGDLLPTDLFRRQVYVNYWFERLEQWHVDAVGADNILFETDFPHPTCLYGDEVTAALGNGLEALPEDVRDKILWKNAAALYRVDLGAW
jgi:predicted TIM-barrel fold metal-dependent hydrolase